MKPQIPLRHLPGLIAACAILALRLLSGLLMWLLGDSVLSSAFVISYFILPALTLAILPPIICRSEDNADRVVFSLIVLAGFFILTMIFRFQGRFPTYTAYSGEEGLSRYESYVGTYVDPLPELEDLGQPSDVEFHYFTNRSAALWGSDCCTLICTYSPDDYAAMTEVLESNSAADWDPLCILDGFSFRWRWFENYDIDNILLTATNDETHEILWAYYAYYDADDLDDIPDPEEFLLEDCGWKFIR